jgi:hypothetical protein
VTLKTNHYNSELGHFRKALNILIIVHFYNIRHSGVNVAHRSETSYLRKIEIYLICNKLKIPSFFFVCNVIVNIFRILKSLQ